MDHNNLIAYTPEVGERFITHRISQNVCPSLIWRTKSVTKKLNRLLQGKDGKDALLSDNSKKFDLPENLIKSLSDYLASCAEKGNRQTTIDMKYLVCGKFLKNLSDLGCTEIQEMTGEQVQTAFLAMGYTGYWERLGPFLRFLYENDILEQNYSGLIQNRRHPMPLPTVYSPEEITCVEKSFDLSSPGGIRNYAITLLMTRYGIRACDVAALTFDNIDFENNRLHFIQQKTDDPWEGELLPEVKAALQNYVKNVRPDFKEYPNVFMKLAPPYAPIDNYAIHTMTWTQFRFVTFDIAGRKRGNRVFRSSIASNMINDGVSNEIVRKVLGHGTKHALKHYARIDVENMRLCPLSVPEPTGIFAEILSGKGALSHV